MTQPPMTPPPGAAPPPPGYASSEDKTWALVSHFGGAALSFCTGGVLSWAPALVAYLARGNQSPTVKEHSKAALNFFIPIAAINLVLAIGRVCLGFMGSFGSLLALLVLLVEIGVAIVGIVFGIMAGMRANEGTLYRYPFSVGLIK